MIDLMTFNHLGALLKFLPGWGCSLRFAVITDVAATNNLGSEGIYYWLGAAKTHFFIDPKEKIIVIFMTQTFSSTVKSYNKVKQIIYQAIVN
tara:strand:+ start:1234 stop:1509 length:276 start_codon:yes stop_codon:yes gene_type:complete